jgi:hypothetical protein
MTCESRSKETSKSASHKMHLVGYDNSDDESTDVYSRFERIDKKKLSLLLMLPNAIKYLTSY